MRDKDDGDPHDLSFPKRHFPRASMVDNMVMSLDQFSPSADTLRSHGSRPGSNRPRGHTKSSSIAIETESSTQTLKETPTVEISPPKSSSNVQQSEQVPNIFGDDEESKREKAYNAQRAMVAPRPVSTRANPLKKSRNDSNSSSIDLGHLSAYAGRLGAAGNRRSQSFDFGSVRPKPFVDTDDMANPTTPLRGADSANITADSHPVAQMIGRRNSGKSAKGSQNRTGRPGTVGAVSGRSVIESPQPQLPVKSQTFDSSDMKSNITAQADPSHTPRAGFFRRVFGTSNKRNLSPSSYPSPSRQSHERPASTVDLRRPGSPSGKLQRAPNTDPSRDKENQPTITKKPSSFFRRRKKSFSGGVPPPLPLTLNSSLETTNGNAGASSPVSSLRAFMDPYLGDGAPKHARGTSLQSVQNADDDPPQIKATNSNDRPRGEQRDANQSNASNQHDVLAKDRALTTTSTGYSFATDRNDYRSYQPKDDVVSEPISRVKSKILPSGLATPPKVIIDTQQLSSATNQTPEFVMAKSYASNQQDGSKDEPPSLTKSKQNQQQAVKDSITPTKMIKLVPQSSGSDTSDYKSAPSTPLVADMPDRSKIRSPAVHVTHPSMNLPSTNKDVDQARRIYNNLDEQVGPSDACAWLGEAGGERERIRIAYMGLFDWMNLSILAALRDLCSKLALKGETQQVDRILVTFARRWCQCNANHGFKSEDIVHTICYSILLLNTDLHLADIGRKMTRTEFVRNAMDTIRENVPDLRLTQTDSTKLLAVRTNSHSNPGTSLRPSMDRSASSLSTTRTGEPLSREESYDEGNMNMSGPLVETPFVGSQTGWETQMESVLKEFYLSIAKNPLPLFGSQLTSRSTPQQSMNNLSTLSTLRRTPSTISKATSENKGRYAGESRSLGARWSSKPRSRARIGSTQAFGSSRTSIDDQSSAWSPSMSSTWSKVSLNKTLTSMSVESFGNENMGGGYQSSIGFANALSQAIIRDEHMESHIDEGIKAAPLLEDESLELYGAPWAKEGILKHKCHLEGVDKRSKDRNWNDCFAVIEKGWMRLFSFSMTAKSLRNKARNHKAGAVVGGGNWQDNAEEIWKFMLRHTIASCLPPPGYSKQRPYVWALSLPNGAVHLFSVGTPDIVKEFVSTANFWSARLSKEPMTGGVSSMEYGWSDSVINRSLVTSDSHPGFNPNSSRPSTQLSMRSSIDHGVVRPRLPGDKAHVTEWVPPQQSLMASQLLEIDQLRALQAYVKSVEDDLQKHNELRGPMLLAFSSRHPNHTKAMTNWEKKSSYLLHEIVKFQTYIDALRSAQTSKEKVDKMRKEEETGRRAESHAIEMPA